MSDPDKRFVLCVSALVLLVVIFIYVVYNPVKARIKIAELKDIEVRDEAILTHITLMHHIESHQLEKINKAQLDSLCYPLGFKLDSLKKAMTDRSIAYYDSVMEIRSSEMVDRLLLLGH